MKKLCTILLLILSVSLCLTSCDLLSSAGGETTANATEGGAVDPTGTGAPATDEVPDSTVTENVVVTDDAGNAVTDDEGNVVTEIVVVPGTDASTSDPEAEGDATNAPEVDGDVTDAPSTDDNATTGSAPDAGDDTPSASIPVVTPTEKTPAAWYAAAYQTLGQMTNGTVRFGMIAEDANNSKEMYAIVKIANGNYSVQEDDWTPLLYVDGIAYNPEYKEYVEMSAEEFCDECFPYYPLTNGMLPFTAEHLEGVSFVEEDGEVYFVLTLTGAEYGELVGENAGPLDAMICTVTFTPNGIMKQALFSASFSYTNEKTGETFTSTSSLSVEFSNLGTTAAITAPADADEYTRVDLGGAEIVTVPVQNQPQDPSHDKDESGKDDSMTDKDESGKDNSLTDKDENGKDDYTADNKDENGKLPSDKNPEYNGNVNVSPEEIYRQEVKENADLNGDGIIGRPVVSPENPEIVDPHIYEEEKKLGKDLNGDGFIGYPPEKENAEIIDKEAKPY